MSDEVLAPSWQLWIAERLLAGASVSEVAEGLERAGVAAERARREVLAVAVQPASIAGRVAGLAATLRRAQRPRARRVDVRVPLDVETLLGVYVAHGVPVLSPGWCADWPAITAWTPDGWRQRLGAVPVDGVERADVAKRDREFVKHTVTHPFADWIDRIEAGSGNDRYLLANHHNISGGLAPLLDDVAAPDGLLAPGWRHRGASLWYGPGGTHTPTHHDTTNVVFCQIRGRKRVWLAPPEEVRLSAARDGFYSPIALSSAGVTAPGGALEGGCVLEVEVGPGDMLLLPAGWWHEVLALETSVSLGLVGLAVENRFAWFRPGFGVG